jgi:uncharacterized protein YaiI (UPF0178 family)
MTRLYVDADACPVKAEIVRVAERHGLNTVMVAHSGMPGRPHPLVEPVLVPQGPDAADDWIAERIGAGDICVTQDIPLAARCLEKGAKALSPAGRVFDRASIGMALAMREIAQHRRELGEATGGPAPFSKRDRSTFLQALETAIQAARRGR